MTATDVRIERRELPEIPATDHEPLDRSDTYAVVTSGHIRGEVERFCYWHPNDAHPLDVVFEARTWGLPEHMGMCDVHAARPDTLQALAAVCAQLAVLLAEAQTRPDLVRGHFLNPA